MKDYKFCDQLLVRIPLLDCQVSKEGYSIILKREDVRAALFLASRAFYNELSKKDFNYSLLSDKQKKTIKKYINRATFRATPFGLFASVSLLKWGDSDKLFELGEPACHFKLDFRILYELWEKQLEKNGGKVQCLQTNTSLYFNSVDYRYIKTLADESCIRFSMVSVEKNRMLRTLLNFCKNPKTWEQILSFLVTRNVSVDEAANFICDLVREQILVSNLSPNITGPDYLSQLASFLQEDLLIKTMERQTTKKIPASQILADFLSLAPKLDNYLSKSDETNHFYCVSERPILAGSLSLHHQKSIEEGLYCLAKLSQPFVNKDLQSFAIAFEKKYETEEVLLLEALDPQFGIGYGSLDKINANYGFLSKSYHDVHQNETSPASQQDGVTSWLLNKWPMGFKSDSELEITDLQLQHLNKSYPAGKKAPSLSVVFRTLDNKVFVESAGGISSLAILGRFCIFDDVYHHAKRLAKEEQLQNENVIFAEIAHLCNLHTANINRRPHFYDYEIPVLAGSVLPAHKQIPLNDLMVSVCNGNIRLRSKRLKKIIIPRLSSAFNYTRNDLPVFRFLCDLQSQGIHTNLSFSLASILPGLKFYPRVIYKSSILQLAEWHLDKTELSSLYDSEDPFAAFQHLAHTINLPAYFSYCVGDNFLVFKSSCQDDIQMFLKEVAQQKTVVLKEFPFIRPSQVETHREKKMLPQYVASLVLQKQTYHHQAVFVKQAQLKMQIDDWIYFKIYCHPLSSDIALMEYLLPLIDKLKKDNLVINWFWVRYYDPEYHLRLRVRTKPKSKGKVHHLFSICLEKLCSQKLASHFQTDRYKRELERYSPQLIEQVEDVFRASSELVAVWLMGQSELNYDDQNTMLNAVRSSAVILNAFAIADQASLCKNAFDSFFIEFSSPKDLKTEMEKFYRRVEKEIDLLSYCCTEAQQLEQLEHSINSLVASHHSSNVKEVSLEKMAMDVIHMHLNRMFIYNQRYFEMIHYYLLQRSLYKRLHKTNQ